MDKKSQRLNRQDWILAGFRALVAGGVPALRIEAVARSMGATKGSFYWHFSGPEDWRDGMLAYWQDKALLDVVAAVPAAAPAQDQLRVLARIISTIGREAEHGGVWAEPALRAWAQVDAAVAEAVRAVDAARLVFLTQILQGANLPLGKAQTAARLIYSAHIGQQALAAAAQQDSKDLEQLIDWLLVDTKLSDGSQARER